MLFGNPVRGTIEKTPIPGNLAFGVTQPFGCTGFAAEPPLGSCAHFHRGIDLGNGQCGGDVLAAAAGVVHWSGVFGNGENYISLDHGAGWFTLYGHLSARAVATGAKVLKGQRIGAVGKTGNATACHNHFGIKSEADGSKSLLLDTNGKWEDPWPLLAQNAPPPEADTMILTKYLPLYTVTVAAGYFVRGGPFTTNAIVPRLNGKPLAAPEVWSLFGVVKGELVNGSDQWYVRVNGTAFEFVHSGAVSGVTAPVVDCSAAIAAATASLQGQLDIVSTDLAAANAKIDAAKAALG